MKWRGFLTISVLLFAVESQAEDWLYLGESANGMVVEISATIVEIDQPPVRRARYRFTHPKRMGQSERQTYRLTMTADFDCGGNRYKLLHAMSVDNFHEEAPGETAKPPFYEPIDSSSAIAAVYETICNCDASSPPPSAPDFR